METITVLLNLIQSNKDTLINDMIQRITESIVRNGEITALKQALDDPNIKLPPNLIKTALDAKQYEIVKLLLLDTRFDVNFLC